MKLQTTSDLLTDGIKRNAAVLCLGITSSLAWLYLLAHSQSFGQATLTQLYAVAATVALCSILAGLINRQKASQLNLLLILAFALLFRLIGFFTFPVLEDDFYRFLWDGYMFASTGSPYGLPPSGFFGQELSAQYNDVLDTINYPDSATIYGPTNQWLFYLSYLIAPGELWPLKIVVAVSDILVLLLLMKRASSMAFILYAWSPLVIKEFIISLHPDIWGSMLVFLALIAFQSRRHYLVGSLLALAAGVKLFALVIVPFLLLWHWRAWVSFTGIAILIALPFGVREAWLPDGLSTMSANWIFNAPLYEIASNFITMSQVKMGLLSLFIVVGASYGIRWLLQQIKRPNTLPSPIPKIDLILGLFFVCLPVFNPWYLIWLIPFAALRNQCWVWVASIMLFLAYATGINLNNEQLAYYEHPNWILVVEFGTIFIVLAIELGLKANGKQRRPSD